MWTRTKYGIKCIETGTFDADHLAVENKHYLFGQSFEKGVWYTEEKIKAGPHGLRLDQIHLEYQEIEGWPVICHVQYDGFEYHLTADTRGKSFTIEVREGYQSKDFGKKDTKNIFIKNILKFIYLYNIIFRINYYYYFLKLKINRNVI